MGILKTFNAAHQFHLDIKGKARRYAIRIQFVGIEPLGLYKDLMRIFIRKTHHLILDRGAVARTDAINFPGK